MSQPRTFSAIETVANTALGYAINVGVQIIAFPYFNIHLTTGHQAGLGAIFTVVSLLRSYVLRRLFNRLH